ncbi:MAG: hypothetical protein ACI93R_003657 [Flavobacteriales bacterium]|jgi:hypothetical protein
MKIVIIASILLLTLPSVAATRAITDEGSVVFLNEDGTWRYESNIADKIVKTKTNKNQQKAIQKS